MIGFHQSIRPGLVLRLTLGASFALIAISLTARLLWVTGNLEGRKVTANEILNVDAEGNLPTWLASSLLLACGLSALTISLLLAKEVRLVWTTFGGLLVFLSADEAASIHEKLISPLRSVFDAGGVFYFAWVIAAIPAVVVTAFLLRNILDALNGFEGRALISALAVLVFGAIGGEMISGPFADDTDSVAYVLVTHGEEAAEFVGASLLLWTLLTAIKRMLSDASSKAEHVVVGS